MKDERVIVSGEAMISQTSLLAKTPKINAADRGLKEFRCPNCQHLLYIGTLKAEIKCRGCGKFILIGV